MGRVSENERDFKAQSYFRLLKYTKPYWLRLSVGILFGFVVGGSLLGSLSEQPLRFHKATLAVLHCETRAGEPRFALEWMISPAVAKHLVHRRTHGEASDRH